MSPLSGTDTDLPVWKLFFQVTADNGRGAGDHKSLQLALLFDAALLHKRTDQVTNELPGRPRGQNGKPIGIEDQEPRRNAAGLDLPRDNEVRQGEVARDEYRRVL